MFLLLTTFLATSTAAATTIPATSNLVTWTGRTQADGSSMYFDWEGVSATVTVADGVSSLTATIIDQCNGTRVGGGSRWAVTMTATAGVSPSSHRIATFFSDPGVTQYVLFSNKGAKCDPDCNFLSPTTFELTRLTESRLSGCTPAANLSVAAFTADVAFLPPPPPKARFLEFIGDSITAGDLNAGFLADGIGSPPQCGNAAVNNDILLCYGAVLCRAFGADCMHTAWGGITLEGMVPLYPFTFSGLGPGQGYSPYSFARVPDAVVVNLGTNGGDNEVGYGAFATSIVKGHYNNTNVTLFLAYGPMTASYQKIVVDVAANLTAGGLKAYALDLTLNHSMTGCFGHPSAADDLEIAAKANTQIAAVMGW